MRITVALWVTVMFVLTPACNGGRKHRADSIVNKDSVPTMRTYGVTTFISDSGIVSYKIIAEEWDIYSRPDFSQWSFEKGVYLEKFDTLMHVTASIKADTAYYYDKKKLWELRSNVHIRNLAGDKFDTNLMFWNEEAKRIYSDQYISIEQADKQIVGYGFESDQSLTNYTIRQTSGIFLVEDTTPADTVRPVAVDTTQSITKMRNVPGRTSSLPTSQTPNPELSVRPSKPLSDTRVSQTDTLAKP